MSQDRKTPQDRALGEFLSEAQDIGESLGKDLMEIDKALKTGEPDPDQVNNLFRAMHTLKSLSGMFGVEPLSLLAHHEESLLEEVRLGRRELTPDLLDLLFESLELITQILGMVGEEGDAKAADNVGSVAVLIKKLAGDTDELAEEELDETPPQTPAQLLGSDVLEVLTEYEEHRLTISIDRGWPLCRIRMRFALDSIDVNLEEIRTILKPIGEIITYLPSSDEGEADTLAIDIIFALHGSNDELESALTDSQVEIQPIETKAVHVVRHTEPPEDPTFTEISDPGDEISDVLLASGDDSEFNNELLGPSGDTTALSLRSVSQTVRVDIRKLDRLMNVVGELAIIRNAISRMTEEIKSFLGRGDLAVEMHKINRGFERKLGDLRDGILEVRMVPVSQMFDRLARMVRKLSRSLGKEIHFVVSGSETEVDKLIIEELSDPLMHIVRNAIDHGIEQGSERQELGKPDFGTVALTAYQKGNHVVVEVEDDGAGIDGQRLVEVALERGLMTAEQAELLSTDEIINLIFLPGLTTAAQTTDVSGRGVGMDVVKTNISALGGVVEVQSETGIGTKFSVTLPVTLAIIPALLVRVTDETYAVPLNTVSEAMLVTATEFRSMLGTKTMALRDDTLALCDLNEFFSKMPDEDTRSEVCVVVTSIGQRRLGLIVDHLFGQQDVVIKTLGKSLGQASCFSGATDIGDERLALVLDTAAIIEEYFASEGAYETNPNLKGVVS
jgi:two-component system, chemotaxis family, sensor kinase CheA